MFGSEFRSVEEAGLVAEIQACTRAEAQAAARRLAAVGELAARATEPDDDERQKWVVDLWACAAAEVGAAMGISHHRAKQQLAIGLSLRERLPKVAALFAAGAISAKLISTITWRTHLVLNAELAARIDAAIAEHACSWGALSQQRLDLAIDAIVETHDPDARRRFHEAARNCDVQIGKPDDATGTASVYGRLSAPDAALLEQRITELSTSVCDGDPRTCGQRRAAALGAIAAGAEQLACHCGAAQCPRAGAPDPRATAIVIHAITDTTPTKPTATPTPAKPQSRRPNRSTDIPAPPMDDEVAPAAEPTPPSEEPTSEPPTPPSDPGAGSVYEPQPPAGTPAAIILGRGGGVIPPALLAELIANGATVRSVYRPDDIADPGYRPPQPCQRFIRMRDLTCRFPGCDRPAQHCDIDHTIPHPAGRTHPSNTKCLCRLHHLLKTFCGWHDQQLPDGTITWTAPSGHTYTTHPLSRMLFPHWNTTTADLPPPAHPPPPPSAQRHLKMPRRRRTRAADTTTRINTERTLNKREVNHYDPYRR
ncbi:hypothetical protein MPUL_10440 [Mycolicibacterium pulveris]|uniref:HNH nuclease domain-containing protein n=1 Tax=Mycolicibacterium pulveris TaxID=36813 RepID=A0A7I7UIA5_MYCPV|nr:HNH endonuclease signature motif containing protein [Mycolicibacterium pulveris]BBY79886.1 hypothetical protein MPUL_10440 [Mycolicibacterium pulveris]